MQAGHTGLIGSELIRSLTRLAGPQAEALFSAAPPAFATQLSQWLGWTDAVALASALDSGTAVSSPLQGDAAVRLLDEGKRVRAALVKAISTHTTASAGPRRWPVNGRAGASRDEDPTDFATHRRRVHAQQQSMDQAVSSLRARLRAGLAQASPTLARLAAVDAVMEQALLPQAQRLTSTVGVLLERRFRGLQAAPAVEPPAFTWLDVFRQDQEAVLLAELDFRFQPPEGLMAALRSTLFAATPAELQPT